MKVFSRHIFVLLLIITNFLKGFGQDKITMLNGNELFGRIIDTTFMDVSFQEKAGSKTSKVERYRDFSINWENKESILYKQDTLLGNFYTEHEMRMFVNGEQDAIKNYKSPLIIPGGIIAGIVGGFVQPLLVQSMAPSDPTKENPYKIAARPIFTPIVPIIYCTIIGAKWIKIKKHHVGNPLYLSEDTYIEGFDRSARSHRIQRAFWSSAIGLVAGLATSAIISTN